MSGQASIWPSQSSFMDPFPFYQVPPPTSPPIEIDWERLEGTGSEESAVKERHDIEVVTADSKGKGKIREEPEAIQDRVRHTNRNIPISILRDRIQSNLPNLYVSGTASISLDLLQIYCDEIKTRSSSSQLRLFIWLIGQSTSPTNDVRGRKQKRRWHVNVYLRAQLEQKQGIRPKVGTVPTSIDLLCADMLQKEVRLNFLEGDLWLLKRLALQALSRNGFRTLRAIENMLEDDEAYAALELLPGSRDFFLKMKECLFVSQAKRGEWEQIWQQKDEIIALLRRQEELGQLHLSDDDWRMDLVLIKSVIAHRARYFARQDLETAEQADLAKDKIFREQMILLCKHTKEIYGEISDKWLKHLIDILTRGVESPSDLHTMSLKDYYERLALTDMVQQLFQEKCHGERLPSTEVLEAMLGLELNWERHCRAHRDKAGRVKMLQQADKHHNKVATILKLLSEQQMRSGLMKETTPVLSRVQTMEDLRMKAIASHISIKLLLSRGDLKGSLRRLDTFLNTVRPDEDYLHLTEANMTISSRHGTTAKAMMKTRRQTRGCFISIAHHLDKGKGKEMIMGIPVLLRGLKESIERGVWDPWPIKDSSTRKSLRRLKLKPHLVDPAANLAGLCTRLLAMCGPVAAVNRDSVSSGFQVVDKHLSSIYFKILEGVALLHRTMERRLAVLDQKGLLGLPENRTRSRHTLRDIFVRRGTSAAQCVWAAFSNPSEADLIVPRLKHLVEEVFLPLGLPGKGWTSARWALMQSWPSHGHNSFLRDQAWSLFEEASQKSLSGKTSAIVNAVDSTSRVQTRMIRRNLYRRERLKERKKVVRDKRISRVLHSRPRR